MEGMSSSRVPGHQQQAAPFVAKTYQMVSDPRTDSLIRWGKGNNSFLVVNPSDCSQFLLPFYFKHSNFSSFVRQLNTYGFKKVDPDKWEFAHQSFLRGQIHLLPYIVRRTRKSHVGFVAATSSSSREEEKKKEAMEASEVEEMVLRQELYRLRQEQRALDQELQVMSKRLQATETKPRLMMSFLAKMAADPDPLSGVIVSKKQQFSAVAKKRRTPSPQPPLPLPPHRNQINDFLPAILAPEIEETLAQWEEEVKPFTDLGGSALAQEQNIISPNPGEFGMSTTSSDTAAAAAAVASFPFSLLGHGFYY